MGRVFLLLVLLFCVSFGAKPKREVIDATSYLVKDLGSGKILFSKNNNKKIAPASLTKIMTAIIAMDSKKLDEVATITKEATEVEPTKCGFKVGEKFSVRDLVKAAMIESANDAAMAIAIHIAGSQEAFARQMNAKARAIGLKNTHFTNPCGFDIKNHYSSASDLAKLTEYALRYRFFNEVVKIKQTKITALDSGNSYTIVSHNHLLRRYPYSLGVKTGFTAKAGACLIARAKKDNKDILLVMLNAKGDRWYQSKMVFDKCFASTKEKNRSKYTRYMSKKSQNSRSSS